MPAALSGDGDDGCSSNSNGIPQIPALNASAQLNACVECRGVGNVDGRPWSTYCIASDIKSMLIFRRMQLLKIGQSKHI